MEYCTLGHILSLWETLSVQMAKTLTINGQVNQIVLVCSSNSLLLLKEPFDTLSSLKKLNEREMAQLNKFLVGVKDITSFLNLLFEFIETSLHIYDCDWR